MLFLTLIIELSLAEKGNIWEHFSRVPVAQNAYIVDNNPHLFENDLKPGLAG